MANIITSKTHEKAERELRSYKNFYGRHDKGAPYPAFCKPQLMQDFEDETRMMRKNLDQNLVKPEAREKYKAETEKRERRLAEVREDSERARKEFREDSDYWMDRRKKIGDIITELTPRERDVKKGRVSSHRQLKIEKGLDPRLAPKDPTTGQTIGLSALKQEYQVISRLADEESNISYLQKD